MARGVFDGGKEKAPAATCRKAIESDGTMEVYGDGKQRRSFLYIDDCINGVSKLMDSELLPHIILVQKKMYL